MKKLLLLFMAFFIFAGLPQVSKAASNEELMQQIKILQQRLAELENKVADRKQVKTDQNGEQGDVSGGTEAATIKNTVKTGLKDLNLNIGASTGYLYATNSGTDDAGKDVSNDKFLVTNFMVGVDYNPENLPVSFSGAYGGTATPSLFDAPNDADNQPDMDFEYADFTFSPCDHFSLELGLIAPNAGYEDTYTYNNKNITVGALASQQPYNAYGTRATFSVNGLFDVYAGFYEDRKDDGEYTIDDGTFTGSPGNSWEAGISGSVMDTDYTVYYYNVNNMRKLLGLVLEKTIGNVYMAFNADYWRWNNKWDKYDNNDQDSIGASLYICPKVSEHVELPLRIEYINQGDSKIYTDSIKADNIFAVTFTPTYNFSDSVYFRIEGAYINADGSFANNQGTPKDSRYYFASEFGLRF